MAKRDYKPASDKQKAASEKSLPKANEALKKKNDESKERIAEGQKRNLGKDPNHPPVGSQAHYDKHGW